MNTATHLVTMTLKIYYLRTARIVSSIPVRDSPFILQPGAKLPHRPVSLLDAGSGPQKDAKFNLSLIRRIYSGRNDDQGPDGFCRFLFVKLKRS
jgi:hypothetical protein